MDKFDYFEYLKSKLECTNKPNAIVRVIVYSAIVITIFKLLNIIL